jgi:hypothetical protein
MFGAFMTCMLIGVFVLSYLPTETPKSRGKRSKIESLFFGSFR